MLCLLAWAFDISLIWGPLRFLPLTHKRAAGAKNLPIFFAMFSFFPVSLRCKRATQDGFGIKGADVNSLPLQYARVLKSRKNLPAFFRVVVFFTAVRYVNRQDLPFTNPGGSKTISRSVWKEGRRMPMGIGIRRSRRHSIEGAHAEWTGRWSPETQWQWHQMVPIGITLPVGDESEPKNEG